MTRVSTTLICGFLSLSASMLRADAPLSSEAGVLREVVRQSEEQFIGSVFNLYEDAAAQGNQNAYVVIERFFRPNSMQSFAARSFAAVLTTPRLEKVIGSSQLPSTRVALDLMSVLYTANVYITQDFGDGAGVVGPVFYDQADIPMTILNEINHKAIEAMEPDEREAVLLRIQEVDRNRDKLTTRRQTAEARTRLLQTARRLYHKYLATIDLQHVVAGIVARTGVDPADIEAWLAELDPIPDD